MINSYIICLIIANIITLCIALRGWYLASRLEKNLQQAGIIFERLACGYGHCESVRKVLPIRTLTENADDCMNLVLDELGYKFIPKKTIEQEPELKKKREDE